MYSNCKKLSSFLRVKRNQFQRNQRMARRKGPGQGLKQLKRNSASVTVSSFTRDGACRAPDARELKETHLAARYSWDSQVRPNNFVLWSTRSFYGLFQIAEAILPPRKNSIQLLGTA